LIQKLCDGEKNVQYNISTNYAMGQIDEKEPPDLFIFVEDEEAAILVKEILKEDEAIFSRVNVRYVGAYCVVRGLADLCKNKRLPYKGISIFDGDKREEDAHRGKNCYCMPLPSTMPPEELVFSELKGKNWNKLDERFGRGAGELFKIFNDAITDTDHHNFTTTIGDKLKLSKDIVWQYFVEEWCKQCLTQEDKHEILDFVKKALNE
jgi:hypothetical protein